MLAATLLLAGCGPSADTGENSQTGQSGSQGSTGEQSRGSGQNDQQAMGRYIESDIAVPEEVESGRDLRLADDGVELVSWDGTLYCSQDQGQTWQMVSRVPEKLQERLEAGTDSYFLLGPAGDAIAGYIEFSRDEEGIRIMIPVAIFTICILRTAAAFPWDWPVTISSIRRSVTGRVPSIWLPAAGSIV